MEKETELYLIQRIKELEEENKSYRDELIKHATQKQNDELAMPKNDELVMPIIDETWKTYKGVPFEHLYIKAKAFETLQKMLDLEVAHWVEQKRYSLNSRYEYKNVHINVDITKEAFDILNKAFTTTDYLLGGINQ